MTKKDFELIASALRTARERVENGEAGQDDIAEAIWIVEQEIVNRLIVKNPRFDQSKFHVACMPK